MADVEMEQAARVHTGMNRAKNITAFIVLVTLGRLWIEYDQDLLPQPLLMPAFIVVLLMLLTGYFFVVNPNNVKKFEFMLSLLLLPVVVLLTIFQHMIVTQDFAVVWRHSLVIWGISFAMPFAAGFVYRFMKCILPKRN